MLMLFCLLVLSITKKSMLYFYTIITSLLNSSVFFFFTNFNACFLDTDEFRLLYPSVEIRFYHLEIHL